MWGCRDVAEIARAARISSVFRILPLGSDCAFSLAMSHSPDAMRMRVSAFAVRLVRFCRSLPHDNVTSPLVRQLVRSGTAVSANYHAAGRARSRAEFTAKLGLVAEEADESVHWLRLLRDTSAVVNTEHAALLTEALELRAIFAAGFKTARGRR